MGSKSSSNSSCVNVADWHIDESVIDLGVVTLQLVFKVVTAAAADTSGRVRLLSSAVLADALPVYSTFPPLHTFSFYHPSFLELLHIRPGLPKSNVWITGTFLQASCSSCHPTNSIKALKETFLHKAFNKYVSLITQLLLISLSWSLSSRAYRQ